MAWLDRALSILLILAGIVHGVHSFHYYSDDLTVLWSVCGALFVVLIGTISLLRASRPGDRALAWICLVSVLAWIAVAFWFGHVTQDPTRPHLLIVIAVTLGVCVFSVRSLMMAKI
jgi:peptidoglycan/LPS O-acetylase OafA/YrhL